MIAGTSGVGKSTVGMGLAAARQVPRILSTDSIREIMRAVMPEDEDHSALHRSSFSMGEVGDPVRDWLDASAAVRPGIDAVLERSRREGTDLILEGVHLLPSLDLLRSWSGDGGIAVGIVLHCEVERTHRERILARESNTYRTASRYLAAMDRIRAIQDAVIDRGRVSGWHLLSTRTPEQAVERIEGWLNQAYHAR